MVTPGDFVDNGSGNGVYNTSNCILHLIGWYYQYIKVDMRFNPIYYVTMPRQKC